MTRLTSTSLETSALVKNALFPCAQIVSTVARPLLSSVSTTWTLAPSRANSIALALPIPLAAPVTVATLPCSFMQSLSWLSPGTSVNQAKIELPTVPIG
jgi:hypothetical protein